MTEILMCAIHMIKSVFVLFKIKKKKITVCFKITETVPVRLFNESNRYLLPFQPTHWFSSCNTEPGSTSIFLLGKNVVPMATTKSGLRRSSNDNSSLPLFTRSHTLPCIHTLVLHFSWGHKMTSQHQLTQSLKPWI